MFISKRQAGVIYVAERSRKGYRKLLWSRLRGPSVDDLQPVEAVEVPAKVRDKAYDFLSRRNSNADE